MAKVTSKYQVTLPKKIADEYQIRPGDNIDWVPAGEAIRVIPSGKSAEPQDRQAQLRMFDQATERHRRRRRTPAMKARGRGWKREDLYSRGSSH